jgi:aminoglycoside 3-N-acetyltransferase
LSDQTRIGKAKLKKDLETMGIAKGDHVAVTLSFKSIGFVERGPDNFIDSLLEVIGPDGTLMMNTFTQVFPVYEVDPCFVFDYKSTPCVTGLVPETLRMRKEALRSKHPVCSVVAIGGKAKCLTEGHDEKASLFLPYLRLAQMGGKYLCIGLGNNLVAIRHEAQRLAGLFDVVRLFHGVQYLDEEGCTRMLVYNNAPCPRKLPDLVPKMQKAGVLTIGKIGNARSVVASADELLGYMAQKLQEDPTLTLCDDVGCLWCREAERKLNLYSSIKNPMYFQKIVVLRTFIALASNFRLRPYNYLSLGKGREMATFLEFLGNRMHLSSWLTGWFFSGFMRDLYYLFWDLFH